MSIPREQQYLELSMEPEKLKSIFNTIKEKIPEFENYYEIWYLTTVFSFKIKNIELIELSNCFNKQYKFIINSNYFKINSIIINNKFCNIHYEYITNNKNICNPIFCFDLNKDIKENICGLNFIKFLNSIKY